MTSSATPYFSIIIPTYNRPELLAHAIESVRRQTFTDWQLIVVDDAGSIPARVPEDDRIVLLRNDTNNGASASFNRGLDVAAGRFVAFLADDDCFAVSRLASAHVEHERGADLVVCRTAQLPHPATEAANPRCTPVQSTPPSRRVSTGGKFAECGPHVGPMGAISIAAEMCPRLDASFPAAEDLEWMVRVCQNRPRVVTIPDTGFLWRQHDGERHGNGVDARILGYHMLLSKHSKYYSAHRAEHALRLRGLGLLYFKNGKRLEAFHCALKSVCVAPNVGAVELMFRTFLPRSWGWSSLDRIGSRITSRLTFR